MILLRTLILIFVFILWFSGIQSINPPNRGSLSENERVGRGIRGEATKWKASLARSNAPLVDSEWSA